MRIFKKIIIILILFVLGSSIYLVRGGYKMYKDALKNEPLDDVIYKIKSKDNYTKITDMSKMYLKAVISVEDHRFYKHKGIDLIAVSRALISDIKEMKYVEGGSTITEQLAKNIYFSQDKNLKRKVAEVFMARHIEKNYSKNEILELYLNSMYFGSGYYTVKEASNGYFNKEPSDMNDYESVMLAGIPNAPSIYNPNVSMSLTKKRQKQVLMKMIKYKTLDKKEAEVILNN